MDPLSITTAVLAISGATIGIYQSLKSFVDAIKNAPKEIDDIRRATGNVYNTISNLQQALEETRVRSIVDHDKLAQKHVNDLVGPLRNCNKTLQCIVDKLREHLRPLSNGRNFRPRYQWWKAKGDFQELLIRLQSDKDALCLSMAGLNTFQTLRTLGDRTGTDHDGTTLFNSSNGTKLDPASSLRSYAATINNGAAHEVSSNSSQELPTASAIVQDISPMVASDPPRKGSPLTLKERRQLAEKKRKRQDDLLKAARNGDDLEVEILLADGVEVDWIDRTEGKSALHLAAQYGHKIVAKQLLDHDADIELRCEPFGSGVLVHHRAGRTPLHWAAAGDDTEGRQEGLVKLLLEHGADATARNDSYRTPLQEAVMYTRLSTIQPNLRVIRLLLAHGAQINARDTCGWTALHEAAFYGKHDLALLLLKEGAEVDGKATESDPAYPTNPELKDGLNPKTPLLLTADRWSIPTIRYLLSHGADVNARAADCFGASGDTLLILAASHNQPTVVRMLLDAKAMKNIQDFDYGDTALHKAAAKGHLEIIRALLDRTADTGMRNKLGRTCSEHARLNGQEAAAHMIDAYITSDIQGREDVYP